MGIYEIIATLGPASNGETMWESMLAAEATAFRLNTSHLELEQLWSWLEKLVPVLSTRQPYPALVLDLQGSKWRLGQFAPLELVEGQTVELVLAPSSDRPDRLPVPHADFFHAFGRVMTRASYQLYRSGDADFRSVSHAGDLALSIPLARSMYATLQGRVQRGDNLWTNGLFVGLWTSF